MDLSLNLKAFVSQRLLKTVDGGRCAAFEVLLNSPRIAELIKTGSITEMKEIMEKSASTGMQTFDMALYKLYQSGKISREEALKYADSENNLSLKIGFGGHGTSHASSATG
jgi:twitching motility protein PilU